MPKQRKTYPDEFKKKLIAMVGGGRTPEELSRQFEPSAQSIRLELPRFTLVGATTRSGMITDPPLMRISLLVIGGVIAANGPLAVAMSASSVGLSGAHSRAVTGPRSAPTRSAVRPSLR